MRAFMFLLLLLAPHRRLQMALLQLKGLGVMLCNSVVSPRSM